MGVLVLIMTSCVCACVRVDMRIDLCPCTSVGVADGTNVGGSVGVWRRRCAVGSSVGDGVGDGDGT